MSNKGGAKMGYLLAISGVPHHLYRERLEELMEDQELSDTEISTDAW